MPAGLKRDSCLAVTAPYAAIVIGRRVFVERIFEVGDVMAAIYSELAPGATVTSALSFVRRDVIHRCRW